MPWNMNYFMMKPGRLLENFFQFLILLLVASQHAYLLLAKLEKTVVNF